MQMHATSLRRNQMCPKPLAWNGSVWGACKVGSPATWFLRCTAGVTWCAGIGVSDSQHLLESWLWCCLSSRRLCFPCHIEALQMRKERAIAVGLTNPFHKKCRRQLSVVHMPVSTLWREHWTDYSSVLRPIAPQGLPKCEKNRKWQLGGHSCTLLRWENLMTDILPSMHYR